MISFMSEQVGAKIRRLRKLLGESQAVFGERFGVEQATVSRWEKGEPVKREFETNLARLANVSVAEFFHSGEGPRLIPVVGDISAGETFIPTDDEDENGDYVQFSVGDDDLIALRVRGNSMSPVYRDGDVIIGRRYGYRSLPELTGLDVIVRTRAGEGYLKRLLRDSKSKYRLRSYNAAFDDIENVEIDWAAPVLWIKRGTR